MALAKTGEFPTLPLTPDRNAGMRAFDQLVGSSEIMQAVFERLRRASASDATILLQGETGTGKEAVAEAIHASSPRRKGPFVVVDCGAFPPQLMEAELFGHEKGAFTGAIAARAGCFEAANQGTVFLDEIGELDVSLQPKLLRALERRHVKRIGSTEYKPVDVRIIAATNRDLRRDVERGTFRSDLFFRLAVVSAALPPLRARAADLSGLVRHILNLLGDVPSDIENLLLDPAFIRELGRYPWPGNVRELRNHIECCVALGESRPPGSVDMDITGVIPLDQFALDLSLPLKEAREVCLRAFEHRYLEGQMARNHANVSAAARAAGVDRAHFYRLLWKYGLREPGNETREMPAMLPDMPGDPSDYT
ncbi:MAG: sigma 54-interacting transcriptional regulator [Deltaproteobacteria bacterium]|nr:sigma 54-interacting transcriptional regulator [Deltaproteobacteria bacterium]